MFFPRLSSHIYYLSANRVVVFKGNFHVTLNKLSNFKIFFIVVNITNPSNLIVFIVAIGNYIVVYFELLPKFFFMV